MDVNTNKIETEIVVKYDDLTFYFTSLSKADKFSETILNHENEIPLEMLKYALCVRYALQGGYKIVKRLLAQYGFDEMDVTNQIKKSLKVLEGIGAVRKEFLR